MKDKKEKQTTLAQKRKEYIATVCAATGWDEEKAFNEMKAAKEAGMPYFRYVKNECWKLNLEEIKALNEQIEARLEKRRQREAKKQEHVKTVMAAAGWDEEKALAELEKAKAIGMPYFRYVKNECWKLSAEEIKTLNEQIEARLEKRRQREEKKKQLEAKKQEHLNAVMTATGWDEEKALAELENAKAIGMPYFRYVKNECWKLNIDEIKTLNEQIEARFEKRKNKAKKAMIYMNIKILVMF